MPKGYKLLVIIAVAVVVIVGAWVSVWDGVFGHLLNLLIR